MQRFPEKNPLRKKKTAVKNASGSGRRKWPTKLQTGIGITTTFTCGWVRVSVQFHYYQVNSPEWRITNSITFFFACFIRQELNMQSCVWQHSTPNMTGRRGAGQWK